MLKLLLFTALVVTGYTTDIRQRLGVPPAPVKGFNINAVSAFYGKNVNSFY